MLRKPVDERLAVYDHLIIHCSATQASAERVDARWIDNLHRNEFGWRGGNGYHAVITRTGDLQRRPDYPTRRVGSPGAHVGDCGRGWNTRSYGICLVGGVAEDGKTPENNFTEAQFASLDRAIMDFLNSHPNPLNVTIMGHRDLIELTGASPKACPCFDAIPWAESRDFFNRLNWDDREDLDRPENPMNSEWRFGPVDYLS